MISGLLISVILIILVGAQIVTTVNVANELSKLRKSTRANHLDIATLQSQVTALQSDISKCHRAVEATRRTQTLAGRLPGEIELHHGGRVAKVQAVFRPRGYS